jgi:hypothetical protein
MWCHFDLLRTLHGLARSVFLNCDVIVRDSKLSDASERGHLHRSLGLQLAGLETLEPVPGLPGQEHKLLPAYRCPGEIPLLLASCGKLVCRATW